MAEFKLVIGTKDGKCVQREVKEAEAAPFLGKKIGDKIEGDKMGLAGYEFEITGGSDYCGFPMRKDVQGKGRKRILAIKGIGLKKKGKGIRQRKTVCGNTIHTQISQINIKVLKEGKEKLGAGKEEAAAEAKSAEAKPAEPKKEAPKPEAKPAEKLEPEVPKSRSEASRKKEEAKPAEPKKEEAKPAEPKPEAKPAK